jgi:glycosyltransferase involved in cell wall biosynthesis
MAVHAIHVDEAAAWGVNRPLWGLALREFGELRLIRKAELIACVTSEVASMVEDYLPDRRRDIVVIGSGIDKAHFRRSADLRLRGRRAAGIAEDAFVIGWHGSFRKFHGLDGLISAFAAALPRLPKGAALLLVGHGVHRTRLLALARELAVEDRVFSPGEVPYDDIPMYVSAMDVGAVLADPNDAFHYSPLKLLEYQASGLPVVVSSAGGMASLRDDVDAIVVPVGDTTALADGLVRLGSDLALRGRIAARGALLADSHTWDSKLDALMDALQSRSLLPGERS